MNTKNFGTRSGLEVADVSIGAMRLPADAIDAVELIRHAIDSGMKYIDTSRGYGESELILGRALTGGYREKVILSSKCSPWVRKIKDSDDGSADSVRRRIDETLVRLGVDYLDFYQVWSVSSPENWELATKKGGMVDGIKRAVADGVVKHIGFTTHEKPENLSSYLEGADWCEVLLITYNLLNRSYEPVLEKAREVGIGTIVMNPVGGGKLTEESPILLKLAEEVGAESVADLAVRYVLANPNVDTILCGVTKLSDVDDTIASSKRPAFSRATVAHIDEFFEQLTREQVHFCTACGYCQPCPAGIKIPAVMGAIYDDRFLGLKENARRSYQGGTRDVKVTACTECGECESKCTQGLEIIQELKWAFSRFEETA